MASRGVVDKAVAIVFPISAFVAAGFRHSIANMYLPDAAGHAHPALPVQARRAAAVTVGWLALLLAVVIAGNLIGGSVLVRLTTM